MKISGFTFVRNASKLYFPIKESISSLLPLCDEFVVAMGDNDPDDQTLELIQSLASPKIKIIPSPWKVEEFPKNTEYARQTDLAKNACTGDWLFYIQSDEVIHENDYEEIHSSCQQSLSDERVEGFAFRYRHFWGDFWHIQKCHQWYPREIRIIRNRPQIHSWRDAQSFRWYESFEPRFEEYLRKEGTRKLKVKLLNSYIYHYGCVRPPELMVKKVKKMDETYHGAEESVRRTHSLPPAFDYGPLDYLPRFEGTHPAVLKDWLQAFSWGDQLQQTGKPRSDRPLHVHERMKTRLTTWFEQNLMGGGPLWGFKNYDVIQ